MREREILKFELEVDWFELRQGKHQCGDSVYDLAEVSSERYVDFGGDGGREDFVAVDWTTSGSAGRGVNAPSCLLYAGPRRSRSGRDVRSNRARNW